ncbi:hypothetical protein CYMTET_3275, partial [Cymbomonas tetramitiformis]
VNLAASTDYSATLAEMKMLMDCHNSETAIAGEYSCAISPPPPPDDGSPTPTGMPIAADSVDTTTMPTSQATGSPIAADRVDTTTMPTSQATGAPIALEESRSPTKLSEDGSPADDQSGWTCTSTIAFSYVICGIVLIFTR